MIRLILGPFHFPCKSYKSFTKIKFDYKKIYYNDTVWLELSEDKIDSGGTPMPSIKLIMILKVKIKSVDIFVTTWEVDNKETKVLSSKLVLVSIRVTENHLITLGNRRVN